VGEAGTLARAGGLTSGKVLTVVTQMGDVASKVTDIHSAMATPSGAGTGHSSKRA
jgi:hypothetical protein